MYMRMWAFAMRVIDATPKEMAEDVYLWYVAYGADFPTDPRVLPNELSGGEAAESIPCQSHRK